MKNRLKSLPAKLKSLTSKRPLILIVLAVVLVAISVSAVGPTTLSKAGGVSSAEHQKELKASVDNSTGAPQNGRDPASQPQNSLASAATKPDGPGQRTDSPASGVKGTHDAHHSSSNNAEQTGINSAGCFYEYGKSDQCVPAHAAINGKLTCEGVRTHGGFPNGVSYSKDRFGLDKNHDGTACGHDD